jgi:hypothetical protein
VAAASSAAWARAAVMSEGEVIEADAIRPQSSHSGLLNSAEFLQQVRGRLAPGGLKVQWAPTWRVVDTFVAVFPYALLLRPVNAIIGSDRPIPFDQAALLAALRRPDIAEFVRRGNPDASDLTKLVDGEIMVWTPETPRVAAPLTDMFPRDEFFLNNVQLDTGAPRR